MLINVDLSVCFWTTTRFVWQDVSKSYLSDPISTMFWVYRYSIGWFLGSFTFYPINYLPSRLFSFHPFEGFSSAQDLGYNYTKKRPEGKASLRRTTHDSISVSILVFRRGYDALCRNSVVSM